MLLLDMLTFNSVSKIVCGIMVYLVFVFAKMVMIIFLSIQDH